MSVLKTSFHKVQQVVPLALYDWENTVDNWCDEYQEYSPNAEICEINIDAAVYLFDHDFERVVLSYAVSIKQPMKRDTNRMQGFPNVNSAVVKAGDGKVIALDKGHFLGHASGGGLDINLFPHRRELNRGWSLQGKIFREMERYVAKCTGTFFYHRPIYNDETWIPKYLEYGILCDNKTWWKDTFKNK